MESDTMRASYETVLKDLQEKREREIQEVNQKYSILTAGIQAILAGTPLSEALPVQGETIQQTAPNGGDVRIMTGEFHGMSYTQATRTILERGKSPLTTQQILAYIQKSGRKVEGKNPAGTIYSSLKRGPAFALVAKNTWGLSDWYGGPKRKIKPEKNLESSEDEDGFVYADSIDADEAPI